MPSPHYDPVPLHSGDIADSSPYDPYAAPSGSPSPYRPSSPAGNMSDFEPPRPGFMGPAGSEGPSIRDSIASSQYADGSNRGSEYNNSLYALNQDTYSTGPALTSTYTTYRDDPNAPTSELGATAGATAAAGGAAAPAILSEKQAIYGRPKNRRRLFIIGGAVAAVLLILAVVLPVIFTVVKKDNKKNGGQSGSSSDHSSSAHASSTGTASSGKPVANVAITGGDGSEVTMEDGSKFTYKNSFGGYWYHDPEDPFNNAAKVNSWTPALNQTFVFGKDRIYGVNLGGWLNTEPFMVPALYEKYYNSTTRAVDEWTLTENMAKDTAAGGLAQLEDHYKTFITEKDFADIAAAGLNFVRIPIGWWAIETREGEPFLAKTSWTYFLKAVEWARKYGIRINLDLHAVPGSQNGWNHSGRLGTTNFLNGPMGYANAQRALDYIRILAEFITQPQYRDVIPFFGILNEPQASVIGQETLSSFYVEAYRIVRAAGGAGKGPIVSFHDGFAGLSKWEGFLSDANDIALDYHPYFAFQGQTSDTIQQSTQRPCDAWASTIKTSMQNFGMTAAGEWSNAINDCGLFLNNVGEGTRYEGTYTAGGGGFPRMGSCDSWLDYPNWDASFKQGMKDFAMSTMDALQNWFFWNWKIGNSTVTGIVGSPAWSYKLGLDNGWMPTDPREADGMCTGKKPFSGTVPNGNGNLPAAVSDQYPWPPQSISRGGVPTALPSYTPTGTLITLPVPTPTGGSKTVDAGNGWANPSDSAGMMVPIPTCSYLDPWVGPTADVPSPLCSGGAPAAASRKRMERVRRMQRANDAPQITPAPKA